MPEQSQPFAPLPRPRERAPRAALIREHAPELIRWDHWRLAFAEGRITKAERRRAQWREYDGSTKGRQRDHWRNNSHASARNRAQTIARRDARVERERAWAGPDLRTAAERMCLSLGFGPDILRDETAWDRAHARVGRAFSNEHVRAFWTRKHQRAEARDARETGQ